MGDCERSVLTTWIVGVGFQVLRAQLGITALKSKHRDRAEVRRPGWAGDSSRCGDGRRLQSAWIPRGCRTELVGSSTCRTCRARCPSTAWRRPPTRPHFTVGGGIYRGAGGNRTRDPLLAKQSQRRPAGVGDVRPSPAREQFSSAFVLVSRVSSIPEALRSPAESIIVRWLRDQQTCPSGYVLGYVRAPMGWPIIRFGMIPAGRRLRCVCSVHFDLRLANKLGSAALISAFRVARSLRCRTALHRWSRSSDVADWMRASRRAQFVMSLWRISARAATSSVRAVMPVLARRRTISSGRSRTCWRAHVPMVAT